MRDLRHLARTNHGLALLLMLLALAVRLAIPTGYMPAHDSRGATMILCSGYAAAMVPASTPGESMAPKSMRGESMAAHMAGSVPMHHAPADNDHRDMPCGFAGMAIAASGGELAVVVAAAFAYAAAPVVVPQAAAPVRVAPRLRPPLRAPPVAQA